MCVPTEEETDRAEEIVYWGDLWNVKGLTTEFTNSREQFTLLTDSSVNWAFPSPCQFMKEVVLVVFSPKKCCNCTGCLYAKNTVVFKASCSTARTPSTLHFHPPWQILTFKMFVSVLYFWHFLMTCSKSSVSLRILHLSHPVFAFKERKLFRLPPS